MPPPPFNGIGAYGRVFLQLYLIYLTLVKKVRISGWYFILYALANMVGVKRVIDLSNNNEYTKIHGYTNFYEMPHYHEFVLSSLINFMVGIYLLSKY